MKEKLSMKETTEALVALTHLVVAIKKISKDGLGLEDLTEIVELSKKADELLAGFEDISKVVDELKDIDQVEIMELVAELIKAFNEIKNA